MSTLYLMPNHISTSAASPVVASASSSSAAAHPSTLGVFKLRMKLHASRGLTPLEVESMASHYPRTKPSPSAHAPHTSTRSGAHVFGEKLLRVTPRPPFDSINSFGSAKAPRSPSPRCKPITLSPRTDLMIRIESDVQSKRPSCGENLVAFTKNGTKFFRRFVGDDNWFRVLALSSIVYFSPESVSFALDVSSDTSLAMATSASAQELQNGFASALLLILFSEIGDKTFFIAALLAARKSSAIVFVGTFGALAVMTVISVFLGRIFHYVDEFIPFTLGSTQIPWDDVAACILLIYFGISTLSDASSLKAEEEQEEAEIAIASFSKDSNSETLSTLISVFALVFVAEWGDKSFFSTIALAAASSPVGVVSGAVFGHAIATLVAVLGGSFFGSFVSEKVIAYIGGTLFLVFAALTFGDIYKNVF